MPCQQIVKDHLCKKVEWKDGWCKQHHPETIEADRIRNEEANERHWENFHVGAWARKKHPELFVQMVEEMEADKNRRRAEYEINGGG